MNDLPEIFHNLMTFIELREGGRKVPGGSYWFNEYLIERGLLLEYRFHLQKQRRLSWTNAFGHETRKVTDGL